MSKAQLLFHQTNNIYGDRSGRTTSNCHEDYVSTSGKSVRSIVGSATDLTAATGSPASSSFSRSIKFSQTD